MRAISKLVFHPIAVWILLLLICGLSISGCRIGTTDAATRGKEVFQTCVPCHGTDGSGNSVIGAPNIAAMKQWYVEAQLQKFRSGDRGMHFNDVEGMRMRPMALSLSTDADVQLVAKYVESMPPVTHPPALKGDALAGDTEFHQICASCHGPNGEGVDAAKAPKLAGVDDWYLATQLRKFRSGVRGTSTKDPQGRLMRTMARTLVDEDSVRNVTAYIGTLKP